MASGHIWLIACAKMESHEPVVGERMSKIQINWQLLHQPEELCGPITEPYELIKNPDYIIMFLEHLRTFNWCKQHNAISN